MTNQSDVRALRVLAVTNLWPSAGSFRGIFVKELVDAQRALGVDVEVEVVAQQRSKADYLLAASRVRRRVRAEGFDLVHVHYGMTGFAGRFVGDVPRVISLYGSDINVPWQRRLTSLTNGGAAARIYPSAAVTTTAGDPDGHVIPNGVDFSLFTPGDRAAARASLGIEPDEKVVLFGGHPDNQVKGHDVFSDTLDELRRRGLQVRELLLAEPDQPRSAVPAKFDAADVLLFTSRKGSEGSPTVVKEAAVMGVPVVSVAVGDVAAVLSDVAPSAVVSFPEPWGTSQAHAELVKDLADRTESVLAAGGRSNGRSRNAHLDSARIAQRVNDIYRDVLRARVATGATHDRGDH